MVTSPRDSIHLEKVTKEIAYLQEDVRRLSAELRKNEALISSYSEQLREKERLVSSFTDLAVGQLKRISTLSAAIQDTILLDPAHRPSPVSLTPGFQPWTEANVTTRRRKKCSRENVGLPPLCFSNQYSALSIVDPQDIQPHDPSVMDDGPASPSFAVRDGPSCSSVASDGNAVRDGQTSPSTFNAGAAAPAVGDMATGTAPPAVACQASGIVSDGGVSGSAVVPADRLFNAVDISLRCHGGGSSAA